jgi:hypothetical protein
MKLKKDKQKEYVEICFKIYDKTKRIMLND